MGLGYLGQPQKYSYGFIKAQTRAKVIDKDLCLWGNLSSRFDCLLRSYQFLQ